MIWQQTYDPLGSRWLSTLVAALPVVVLLGLVALGHIRAWMAALLGLGAALAVAVFAFRMPAPAAFGSALYGAAYGLFPIGWIVLNVMFLHTLTVQSVGASSGNGTDSYAAAYHVGAVAAVIAVVAAFFVRRTSHEEPQASESLAVA